MFGSFHVTSLPAAARRSSRRQEIKAAPLRRAPGVRGGEATGPRAAVRAGGSLRLGPIRRRRCLRGSASCSYRGAVSRWMAPQPECATSRAPEGVVLWRSHSSEGARPRTTGAAAECWRTLAGVVPVLQLKEFFFEEEHGTLSLLFCGCFVDMVMPEV